MDGLPDAVEDAIGTPSDDADADADNDTITDRDEVQNASFVRDDDAENPPNWNDIDSDNDTIPDSVEAGDDDPLDLDTDDGGISDGVEDADQNGRIDDSEHDPNTAGDDFQLENFVVEGGGCSAGSDGGLGGFVLLLWGMLFILRRRQTGVRG
ncbi:MAG: hypothetical protein ACI9MR_002937 [Myxococcota bacterium]|jgi:uncharacterized protein (TIGR03382 family)